MNIAGLTPNAFKLAERAVTALERIADALAAQQQEDEAQ
jgi:hypothetical protein